MKENIVMISIERYNELIDKEKSINNNLVFCEYEKKSSEFITTKTYSSDEKIKELINKINRNERIFIDMLQLIENKADKVLSCFSFDPLMIPPGNYAEYNKSKIINMKLSKIYKLTKAIISNREKKSSGVKVVLLVSFLQVLFILGILYFTLS